MAKNQCQYIDGDHICDPYAFGLKDGRLTYFYDGERHAPTTFAIKWLRSRGVVVGMNMTDPVRWYMRHPVLPTIRPMKPFDAWLYAAEWGSYMTCADPGACMYGFSEDCRVQSEDHRASCLAWIDAQCVPNVQADPKRYDDDELGKLASLRLYLTTAEVAS